MDNPPGLELKNFFTAFLAEKWRFSKKIFSFTFLFVLDSLLT